MGPGLKFSRSLCLEKCELLRERLNLPKVHLYIMVAAPLMDTETIVTPYILTAESGATEVDHSGEILLLFGSGWLVSDGSVHVSVEMHSGQFNRMARDYSRVEAVEPAGFKVIPWAIFDDLVIVDAVALAFLKGAIRDLKHADGR